MANSKLPGLSFGAWMRNSIVIVNIPYWFLLFIIVQLKPLAIKIIEIIWLPIEALEQGFFDGGMEGYQNDFEELPPNETDLETESSI